MILLNPHVPPDGSHKLTPTLTPDPDPKPAQLYFLQIYVFMSIFPSFCPLSGLSQPRRYPSWTPSAPPSHPARPPAPAAQRGEVRSNGPAAGPVGPDGRRGGACPEGGAARHEAAKEGRGQAEVSVQGPEDAGSVEPASKFQTATVHGDVTFQAFLPRLFP